VYLDQNHAAGKDQRLMSFKGALDTIVANTARYLRRQKHARVIRKIGASTIEMIVEKIIDLRFSRWAPSVLKKRSKSFICLTAPRAEYKAAHNP
jgi:hypothetical protein